MGDTHGLTTRREILKRGAIVGGGVLWVTPVVQTLGMGSAFAQAVSGDTCKMTLEYGWCERNADDPTVVTMAFLACSPPGCPCNPLPADHDMRLIVNFEDGTVFSYGTIFVDDFPDCRAAIIPIPDQGGTAQALCGKPIPGGIEIGTVIAESELVVFTLADIEKCVAAIP